MDMDFAVGGPLVRCLRLVLGFCPSTHAFARCFLQTPPRDGKPLHFASPSPPSGWAEDFHFQTAEHAQHTSEPGCAGAFSTRHAAGSSRSDCRSVLSMTAREAYGSTPMRASSKAFASSFAHSSAPDRRLRRSEPFVTRGSSSHGAFIRDPTKVM